jgi:hypothetical protein
VRAQRDALRDCGGDIQSAIQRGPEKFLRWLESASKINSMRGDTRVAMDAQVRVMRQYLEYLRGDEWLMREVEHANRLDSTGERK